MNETMIRESGITYAMFLYKYQIGTIHTYEGVRRQILDIIESSEKDGICTMYVKCLELE